MSKLKIRGFEEHVDVPVTVELIDDVDVEFVVKFKRLDRKKLEKVVKEVRARAIEGRDLEQKKLIAKKEEAADFDKKIDKLNSQSNDTLIEGIVSWSEFYDEDDNEVPFSRANLKQVLDHPAYLQAIDLAFWRATGERIKN